MSLSALLPIFFFLTLSVFVSFRSASFRVGSFRSVPLRFVLSDGWGARVDIQTGPENVSADGEGSGTGRDEKPAHVEAPARAGLP